MVILKRSRKIISFVLFAAVLSMGFSSVTMQAGKNTEKIKLLLAKVMSPDKMKQLLENVTGHLQKNKILYKNAAQFLGILYVIQWIEVFFHELGHGLAGLILYGVPITIHLAMSPNELMMLDSERIKPGINIYSLNPWKYSCTFFEDRKKQKYKEFIIKFAGFTLEAIVLLACKLVWKKNYFVKSLVPFTLFNSFLINIIPGGYPDSNDGYQAMQLMLPDKVIRCINKYMGVAKIPVLLLYFLAWIQVCNRLLPCGYKLTTVNNL